MAYKISDECISCGACEAGCPVDAISEGDGKYVIDADTCIDCGACADSLPCGRSSGGIIKYICEKGKARRTRPAFFYLKRGRKRCFDGASIWKRWATVFLF